MAGFLFGYHPIEELLRKGGVKGTLLLSRTNSRLRQLRDLAVQTGVPVSEATDAELDRICGSVRHRGALLLLSKTPPSAREDLKVGLGEITSEKALVLLLDGITDPQNLGAVLRSADQFGVDLVILPARRTARESQTVAQTSAGASAFVPVSIVPNLLHAVQLLKDRGFWVFGTALEGTPIDTVDLSGKIAIVLGSEGGGLRRLLKEKCDGMVRIPSTGHVDSFNVSVAAGIITYEVRRQQRFPWR